MRKVKVTITHRPRLVRFLLWTTILSLSLLAYGIACVVVYVATGGHPTAPLEYGAPLTIYLIVSWLQVVYAYDPLCEFLDDITSSYDPGERVNW